MKRLLPFLHAALGDRDELCLDSIHQMGEVLMGMVSDRSFYIEDRRIHMRKCIDDYNFRYITVRFDQFDMGMSLPDGYFFGSVPAVIDVALCLPFHSLVDGVDFFQACNSFEQLTEVVLPQFLSFFYMSHFASVLHNSPALFKDFMQITIYSNTPLPVEIPDGYNIESVWGAGAMHSLYWPDILRHRQSRDKQIQKIGNRLVQITF